MLEFWRRVPNILNVTDDHLNSLDMFIFKHINYIEILTPFGAVAPPRSSFSADNGAEKCAALPACPDSWGMNLHACHMRRRSVSEVVLMLILPYPVLTMHCTCCKR